MQAARVGRVWSVLLCSGAAALLLACDAIVVDNVDNDDNDDNDDNVDNVDVDLNGEGAGTGAEPRRRSVRILRRLGARRMHAASRRRRLGHTTLTSASSVAVVDFEATANHPALDAVISLSNGTATSFSHLATSVRFSTAGVLDVRDGATYRADASVPHVPGLTRKIRILADLPSHTFSVYVDVGNGHFTERLARRYAFRTTTAAVPSLDRPVGITDGAAGTLSLCNVIHRAPTRVAYTREGAFGVVPLAGDTVLVSNRSSTTMRLSATGEVLNQVAVGASSRPTRAAMRTSPASRAASSRSTPARRRSARGGTGSIRSPPARRSWPRPPTPPTPRSR